MKFDINSKKSKNKRNYKQAMDLNVDRYGPSATQDNFAFTKTKMKKESSFKMKGFSGFGNSPAKFDPSKDLRAKANIGGKFQDVKNLAKPKFDPNDMRAKVYKSGEFKSIISKKPASYGSKVLKGFKTLAKGLGRRATGVAGLMMGTMGTALGNVHQNRGSKPKPNFKAVGKGLKKAVYEGNKKRYK